MHCGSQQTECNPCGVSRAHALSVGEFLEFRDFCRCSGFLTLGSRKSAHLSTRGPPPMARDRFQFRGALARTPFSLSPPTAVLQLWWSRYTWANAAVNSGIRQSRQAPAP